MKVIYDAEIDVLRIMLSDAALSFVDCKPQH
jgi:hypothetical protein